MAQILADRRDIDFVLHEQLKVENLAKHEPLSEFNRKAIDLIISEARNLAVKEILPTQVDGDRIGVHFDNGKVTVPESFHKAWKALRDGEWLAMTEDPEWGGQGMPRSVATAAADFLMSANFAFMMYAGLTHGAGKLIETFGTDKQKKLFLKKLFSGEWTGTMLLTEPEAGSDVGALTTTATPNPDGTYSITGNKIFISGGEHDLAGNIIHPVLARIEGAPAGTAGISLFIVPKIWVNDDGSLGEPNDVGLHRHRREDGHSRQRHLLARPRQQRQVPRLPAGRSQQGHARHVPDDERRPADGRQPGLWPAPAPRTCYALNYARTRIQGRHLLQDDGQGRPRRAHHPAPRRAPHADDHEGLRGKPAQPLLTTSPSASTASRRPRTRRRRPGSRASSIS